MSGRFLAISAEHSKILTDWYWQWICPMPGGCGSNAPDGIIDPVLPCVLRLVAAEKTSAQDVKLADIK